MEGAEKAEGLENLDIAVVTKSSMPDRSRPSPPKGGTAPFSSLGFWRGCLEARKQIMGQSSGDYERAVHATAIQRIETIMEGIEAGTALEALPDFHRWLAYKPAWLPEASAPA